MSKKIKKNPKFFVKEKIQEKIFYIFNCKLKKYLKKIKRVANSNTELFLKSIFTF